MAVSLNVQRCTLFNENWHFLNLCPADNFNCIELWENAIHVVYCDEPLLMTATRLEFCVMPKPWPFNFWTNMFQ